MATQQEIGASYNYLDELFRMCIGENGDFTAAFYDGDFSLTLEEAQQKKHRYIWDNIHMQAGQRMLDIGSGWGPLLKFARDKGGQALGITLSTAQAESCKRHNFEVYVQDWKSVNQDTFGTFDAIASVGAFEHFCSKEEYEAGQQDQIYQDFFKCCADLLPTGGRLFLQTQLFGKNNVKDHKKISIHAPKGSPEFLIALVEKFYPGSWLPYNIEQITHNAAPHFKLVSTNNGRLDYLQTIKEWRHNLYKFEFMKYMKILGLVKFLFTDKDFRFRIKMINVAAHKRCFEQEIFDHERMVFEKI